MSGFPRQLGAQVFIAVMGLGALACFYIALSNWQSTDPVKFLSYLTVALLASSLKIKLPGINGTMSVNFLFILLGVLEMSFAETLVIGFAAVLVQSYWKSSKRLQPIHVIFNLSYLPVGTAAAYYIYQIVTTHGLHPHDPLAVLAVAITYFAVNTFAMATIIRLTEGKPVLKVWSECYFWFFPYYLVG